MQAVFPVAAAYDASERDDEGPATARRRTYVHDVLRITHLFRHVPRTNTDGVSGISAPQPSLFIRLCRHARDARSLVHVLRLHAYMLFVCYG